jgi:hypothetical protein
MRTILGRCKRRCSVPRLHRPADADPGPQHHRLRRAEQGEFARRARSAAGRGRDPADQASVRLARGRALPGAGRRARALCRGAWGSAAASCATSGASSLPSTKGPSRTGCSTQDAVGAQAAGRLGCGVARFPGRRQGFGQSRDVGPGAECGGAQHPLVDRRLGRSGALEQHDAESSTTPGISARTTTVAATCTSACANTAWPRSATAWPSPACGPTAGRSLSSPITAAGDAVERPDAPAGAVRADPRFDRSGRRRPDASAGRTSGRLPQHSGICWSSGRRTPTKCRNAIARSWRSTIGRRRWC